MHYFLLSLLFILFIFYYLGLFMHLILYKLRSLIGFEVKTF